MPLLDFIKNYVKDPEFKKHNVACIASNGVKNYFAVKGKDGGIKPTTEEERYANKIVDESTGKIAYIAKKYLDSNTIRCVIGDSFTVIMPVKDFPVDKEDDIYKELYDKGNKNYTFGDLTSEIKPFTKPYDSKDYTRCWVCAERKIIGYERKINELYGSKRPCYYCLPALNGYDKVVFCDSDRENDIFSISIRKIKGNDFFIEINKLSD